MMMTTFMNITIHSQDGGKLAIESTKDGAVYEIFAEKEGTQFSFFVDAADLERILELMIQWKKSA